MLVIGMMLSFSGSSFACKPPSYEKISQSKHQYAKLSSGERATSESHTSGSIYNDDWYHDQDGTILTKESRQIPRGKAHRRRPQVENDSEFFGNLDLDPEEAFPNYQGSEEIKETSKENTNKGKNKTKSSSSRH